MENTLENKAKFFALYYGQEVLTRDDGFRKFWKLGSEVSIESSLSKYGYDYGYYLELTPLSQITNEDAIEVARIFNIGHLKGVTVSLIKSILSALDGSTPKSETTEFVLNWLTTQDYLRSKGYALPWLNTTIEQQIEFGWIKLNEGI